LLSRVLTSGLTLVETVEHYLECRRQSRSLLALDDRMLKDIGVSRADILRISSAPYSPRKRRRRIR